MVYKSVRLSYKTNRFYITSYIDLIVLGIERVDG
jgi:hypothetical protein